MAPRHRKTTRKDGRKSLRIRRKALDLSIRNIGMGKNSGRSVFLAFLLRKNYNDIAVLNKGIIGNGQLARRLVKD